MDTQKRGFETKEEAEEELRRIVNTNYNPCKKVKPCRCYYSDITKMWHLTSKTSIKIY